MNLILLASGKSERISEKYRGKAKQFLELGGKPLLQHLVTEIDKCTINEKIIITGSKTKDIKINNYRNLFIKESQTMLHTLKFGMAYFVENNIIDDLLISYSDILYSHKLISEIIYTDGDIIIPGNLNWKKLWEERGVNYLDDVESFTYDENNYLIEIGQKVIDPKNVMAQFMGLLYIKKEFFLKFNNLLCNYIDEIGEGDSSTTTFLNHLINKNIKCRTLATSRGWLELDTPEDYILYCNSINDGTILDLTGIKIDKN